MSISKIINNPPKLKKRTNQINKTMLQELEYNKPNNPNNTTKSKPHLSNQANTKKPSNKSCNNSYNKWEKITMTT